MVLKTTVIPADETDTICLTNHNVKIKNNNTTPRPLFRLRAQEAQPDLAARLSQPASAPHALAGCGR